ncbi:MAG: HNH endonuclease [Bacteroidetes bacterium]|nr:MAG: HNH endonuclease [Bacteroidota bacterium]
MKERFIIANITWNPTRWRDTYTNPKAGHKYARKFPGHESLNFKFDKKGIDNKSHIFGFVQWKYKPIKFENGGIIIFYSKNTDEQKGQIVGIYCNVEILSEKLKLNRKGFENNILDLNIKADKDLSLLFPISLDADTYKTDKIKRLTGQVGFSYHNITLAENIVKDELIELIKSGVQKNEFNKLRNIYSYITGKEFDLDLINANEIEQQELISFFKNSDKAKIINDLSNLKETETETVYVNQKTYKRDNKTIAQLKIIRDFKCQICETKITKKNGDFYIEAAHIKPKHKKGRETPDNILILCPNHHKEFDYGDRKIIQHSKEQIEFKLNGINHKIDLKI